MVERPKSRPFLASGSFDVTDDIANNGGFIEFYHVISGENVRFKAFMDSFSDTYSPSWSEEEVYGRMDDLPRFKKTSRVINIGLSVPSTDIFDAKDNVARFSRLVSMLYPSYSIKEGGAGTINSAPLIKLKFMNLIQDMNSLEGSNAEEAGLLGYINSDISMAPDVEMGWFRENAFTMYPKMFSFTVSFKVLHQHPLGWTDKDRRTSFTRFPYGLELEEPSTKDQQDPQAQGTPETNADNSSVSNDAESRKQAVKLSKLNPNQV